MIKILPRSFYARQPMTVAPELLGKKLVRIYQGRELSGIICETEAYLGETDSAAHSFRGRTLRNEVMYGPAGVAYVYFIYGRYHMLNIVTNRENVATAVLIRALLPMKGTGFMTELRGNRQRRLADGPGKLCQALAINRSLNGWDLTRGDELWLEPLLDIKRDLIHRTPRIGIQYARQKDQDALLRFEVKPSDMKELIKELYPGGPFPEFPD
jgi:DNA-3-methyladenine glycosylase